MNEKAYQCPECRKRQTAAEVPQCCGRAMIEELPMDQCTLTSTPEHSRLDDPADPCDDGRAG